MTKRAMAGFAVLMFSIGLAGCDWSSSEEKSGATAPPETVSPPTNESDEEPGRLDKLIRGARKLVGSEDDEEQGKLDRALEVVVEGIADVADAARGEKDPEQNAVPTADLPKTEEFVRWRRSLRSSDTASEDLGPSHPAPTQSVDEGELGLLSEVWSAVSSWLSDTFGMENDLWWLWIVIATLVFWTVSAALFERRRSLENLRRKVVVNYRGSWVFVPMILPIVLFFVANPSLFPGGLWGSVVIVLAIPLVNGAVGVFWLWFFGWRYYLRSNFTEPMREALELWERQERVIRERDDCISYQDLESEKQGAFDKFWEELATSSGVRVDYPVLTKNSKGIALELAFYWQANALKAFWELYLFRFWEILIEAARKSLNRQTDAEAEEFRPRNQPEATDQRDEGN